MGLFNAAADAGSPSPIEPHAEEPVYYVKKKVQKDIYGKVIMVNTMHIFIYIKAKYARKIK